MAHHFEFKVSVEVERVSGKFASRDEIAESIIDELQSAEPYGISGIGADGDSEYEVAMFEVEEVPQ